MEPHLYYEQYLFAAALDHAISKGYYFGEDCEHDFRWQLKNGVNRMFAEDPNFGDDILVRARENTIRLVDGMIAEINDVNKLKRLRETSLLEALRKMCPLFPFC
jgi:hypothetical protein